MRISTAIQATPTLTNDAASPFMVRITIARSTAPLSCVSASRYTFTHQHARPSCHLKDIVNAFNLQRRALFVSARADRLRDSLCLSSRDESANTGVITRWTQVRFAAYENYGDGRSTYGPHFFDPLIYQCDFSLGSYNPAIGRNHTLKVTFSNESGVSIANAIRIT
jgi:hypothetical protein